MEPTIGSGNLISAQIISDDGHPIQDHPLNGEAAVKQEGEESTEINQPPLEPKIIQWKLTLHQIGRAFQSYLSIILLNV